ncbi:unnamed protein product [Camellia sinensis]
MEDDWDLHAVVRGCATTSSTTTTTTTTTTATTTSSCSYQPRANDGDDQFIFFPDPFESRIAENGIDLHDVFKPFFPKSQTLLSPQNTPISPLSVLGGLRDLPAPPQQQQLQEEKQKLKQSVSGARTSCTSVSSTTTSHTPRSKRRKNQSKRVCQVPAEGLSSDTWSWRKYGQKPIKGSPYPRGYYRCSTSKGCSARKQVERNRSDPGMFILTYTGEHNHPMPTHRNSLAGSTRQKPVTPQTVTAGDATKPSSSSSPPVSPAASLSPVTEKMEEREDEDDEFGVSDMVITDDFFEGLEELTGDCYPDDFPASLTFPWLVNKAATTAAGGG